MNFNDTQLLDFLQHLTNRARYTGRVIVRESIHGRGWRLMETTQKGADTNVRRAIVTAILKAVGCDHCGSINTQLIDSVHDVIKPFDVSKKYDMIIWKCLDCGYHWNIEKRI